jgi:hypothetical protein
VSPGVPGTALPRLTHSPMALVWPGVEGFWRVNS